MTEVPKKQRHTDPHLTVTISYHQQKTQAKQTFRPHRLVEHTRCISPERHSICRCSFRRISSTHIPHHHTVVTSSLEKKCEIEEGKKTYLVKPRGDQFVLLRIPCHTVALPRMTRYEQLSHRLSYIDRRSGRAWSKIADNNASGHKTNDKMERSSL